MAANRRAFLKTVGAAWVARAQAASVTRTIQTPALDIAYEETGVGFPAILLHGFPDDVHAWDDVAPALVQAGYRVWFPICADMGQPASAMPLLLAWRSKPPSDRI